MKQTGMLESEPDVPDEQTVVRKIAAIRPHAGGVLYPEVGLDQLGHRYRMGRCSAGSSVPSASRSWK